MTNIICIAGFGDNTSMFDPLLHTQVASKHQLFPFNLPGFGAPPLVEQTTLSALAESVNVFAKQHNADVILAHSVASIIASLAALDTTSTPIKTVISLEGNLTAEDAYFSGTAADYDTPEEFYTSFLARLNGMIADRPIIERYREQVMKADVRALWELGSDARRFSEENIPGEILMKVPSAKYMYNPANVPSASLDWLQSHDLASIRLDDAFHWASVDAPDLLSRKLLEVLDK